MQIEKNGSGPWPGVEMDGVTVTLTVGDDALSFDCAALQEDGQVTVDVVRGHGGALAVGVANGTPAPTTESVRVPLAASDMEAVRLILWTVTDNMEA